MTLQASCLAPKVLVKCNEKCLGTGCGTSGDLGPTKHSIVSKRTNFRQVQCCPKEGALDEVVYGTVPQ